MIINSDSLKAKLKNKSKETNIPSDTLLKMFMFERFLMRVSNSIYKDNFILKGGFLISSIFGINSRSTVDVDTTIKGLPLNRFLLENMIKEIMNVKIDDTCSFEILSIKDIRSEDVYNGYEVMLKASMNKVWTYITVDVTTGDAITYREVEFNYMTLLDNERISILSYNYETILAEKYEAIISRNIDNSRMKDYYDVYMFVSLKWNDINKEVLRLAIKNTSEKRSTTDYIKDSNSYIERIENNIHIKELWEHYQTKFDYAKNIEFNEVMSAIKIIAGIVVKPL